MIVDAIWLNEQAELTLARLLPRLERVIAQKHDGDVLMARLREHFADAFEMFYHLYGNHYDFYFHLEQTLLAVIDKFDERPARLKALDVGREADPDWFQSEQVIGAICYVDLFAGNLAGIRECIPYFEELGLTYLHLMPLFRTPEHNNDSGYTVSSYREVNPALGTMDELATLAAELQEHDISLALDFVINHTSDEHEWALRALSGDSRYQDYYRMFNDRTVPDRYEPSLREILPDQAPENFTFRPEVNKWVWTTFHSNAWDLNYENPEVFQTMLEELLFLANHGAEILRLDAVPFTWKQLGTNSENLPQAHMIIRAFNAFARIAAPALLFNSDAIVHPSNVRSYIDPKECQLSNNPILMVAIWEALATRTTDFLCQTMNRQFPLPPGCAWINYLRSHDDIGWGFADEDAAQMGLDPADHRYFLNLFYLGRFPGSFATGLPFNFNPSTLDMRISGTTASLAGLEKANKLDDAAYRAAAIQRIIMIHSLILSAGGIPLIYLGDEIGTINDYSYRNDPAKKDDNRWVHRPFAQPGRYEHRHDQAADEGQIFTALLRLIHLRKQTPLLADGETHFLYTGNSHVLGYTRHNSLLVLANFTEFPQMVSMSAIQNEWSPIRNAVDLVSDAPLNDEAIQLTPYQFVWLVQRST